MDASKDDLRASIRERIRQRMQERSGTAGAPSSVSGSGQQAFGSHGSSSSHMRGSFKSIDTAIGATSNTGLDSPDVDAVRNRIRDRIKSRMAEMQKSSTTNSVPSGNSLQSNGSIQQPHSLVNERDRSASARGLTGEEGDSELHQAVLGLNSEPHDSRSISRSMEPNGLREPMYPSLPIPRVEKPVAQSQSIPAGAAEITIDEMIDGLTAGSRSNGAQYFVQSSDAAWNGIDGVQATAVVGNRLFGVYVDQSGSKNVSPPLHIQAVERVYCIPGRADRSSPERTEQRRPRSSSRGRKSADHRNVAQLDRERSPSASGRGSYGSKNASRSRSPGVDGPRSRQASSDGSPLSVLQNYGSFADGDVLNALNALQEECKHDKSPNTAFQDGLGEALLNYLEYSQTRAPSRLRVQCCKLIAYLARSDTCEVGFVKLGALNLLASQIVDGKDIEVQVAATTALGNLCVQQSHKGMAVDAGILPSLVSLLRGNSSTGQRQAARCMANLARDQSLQSLIASEGALGPLIHLLDSKHSDVRRQVLVALANLSVDDGNESNLVRLGAIPKLLRMVEQEQLEISKQACRVLVNLSAHAKHKFVVMEDGGGPILSSAAADLPPEVSRVAMRAIASVGREPDCAVNLVEAGVLESLCAVLKRSARNDAETAALKQAVLTLFVITAQADCAAQVAELHPSLSKFFGDSDKHVSTAARDLQEAIDQVSQQNARDDNNSSAEGSLSPRSSASTSSKRDRGSKSVRRPRSRSSSRPRSRASSRAQETIDHVQEKGHSEARIRSRSRDSSRGKNQLRNSTSRSNGNESSRSRKRSNTHRSGGSIAAAISKLFESEEDSSVMQGIDLLERLDDEEAISTMLNPTILSKLLEVAGTYEGEDASRACDLACGFAGIVAGASGSEKIDGLKSFCSCLREFAARSESVGHSIATEEAKKEEVRLSRKVAHLEERVQELSGTLEESKQREASLRDQMRKETVEMEDRLALSEKRKKEQLMSLEEQFKIELNDAEELHRQALAQQRERMASQSVVPLTFALSDQVEELKNEKEKLHEQFRMLVEYVSPRLGQVQSLQDELIVRNNKTLTKCKRLFSERQFLYNKLQSVNGNIRVLGRIRPVLDEENEAKDPVVVFPQGHEGVIVRAASKSLNKAYELDSLIGPQDPQEEVFAEVRPLMLSVLDGYDVTIFVYGGGGSGKTYSMVGEQGQPGLMRRCIKELYRVANQRSAERESTYQIGLSCCDVTGDSTVDLLSKTGAKPDTKHNSKGSFNVDWAIVNVKSEQRAVHSINDSLDRRDEVFEEEEDHDRLSSLVVQIHAAGTNILTDVETTGRLTLVQLPDSDVAVNSKQPGNARTAQTIQASLSCINDVLVAKGSQSPHVPYRNSKLTHLLQPCLEADDSKALVLATMGPCSSTAPEVISTLNFCARIRNAVI